MIKLQIAANGTQTITKVCNMCGSDWTTQTKLEKFCGKCNSHLIEIGGEVYSQQGW